jgi:hypothetical protein
LGDVKVKVKALWDLTGPPADESAGYIGNAPSGLGFSPERALSRSPDIHVRAVAGDTNPLNSQRAAFFYSALKGIRLSLLPLLAEANSYL